MKKTNLKIVATNKEQKTAIEQLADKGFTVKQIGDDTFTIVSEATGATLERDATAKDLERYLRCMAYVSQRHGGEINAFKYTRPAHA